MGSKIKILLIFLVLFFMQCLQTTEGHLMKKHDDRNRKNLLRLRQADPENKISEKTPELNMFFHYNTLKSGKKLQFYFPTSSSSSTSSSPHLLSRQESDSIPFSTSQLRSILDFFSFPETSKQGLAMKTTLEHCESEPMKGETKFCAASLESMLDSIRGVFGFDSRFKVITTNYLSPAAAALQNYTVIGAPTEISARKIVACHLLPYPYAVFYCHGQDSDNKLYKVLLAGEDGARVEAAAICHMDTTEWDPSHVAFRVLETVPGGSPVCHVFPAGNLVWVPLS